MKHKEHATVRVGGAPAPRGVRQLNAKKKKPFTGQSRKMSAQNKRQCQFMFLIKGDKCLKLFKVVLMKVVSNNYNYVIISCSCNYEYFLNKLEWTITMAIIVLIN